MDMREVQRRAFEQYTKQAALAREAKAKAEQARRLADMNPGSNELAQNAADVESQASTQEKERHLAKLKTKESHQPGEDNGCVTRCVGKNPREPPYGARALFPGHNHKENAIKYHVANERHWYNLAFHKEGSRPRQRLMDAVGFKYKPPAKATKKEKEAGKKLELGMRLTGRSPKNNPLATAGAWDMGLAGENFWSGSTAPWKHEAHHIIPTDILYQTFEEDMGLLQQLKYNIHRGVNIIILPRKHLLGWVYLLPAHVNNHPGYSREVLKRLRSVRNAVSEQQEQTQGHPDMSETRNKPWRSQLENHSKQLRKLLRKEGLRTGLSGQYKYLTLDDVLKPTASTAASV